MDFYSHAGVLALGSRLRRLSDAFATSAVDVFQLYGANLDPKWFPVFYVLPHREEVSVTEIAREIGHSHASVSQIVSEMKQAGLVDTSKSGADGRVSVLRLSDAGRALLPRLELQYRDVRQAVEALLAESRCNLWSAIEETERMLQEKNLLERVRAARRDRECDEIEIVDYEPRYRGDFERLNKAWIERYWELEEADHRTLGDPDGYVVARGGHILLVRRGPEIIGTCALIPMADGCYELAKMAVDAREQGRGIGRRLALAVVDRARALGADRLYLESNTVLEPAIRLYRKLGFTEVVGAPSPYDRCNIQMELRLGPREHPE